MISGWALLLEAIQELWGESIPAAHKPTRPSLLDIPIEEVFSRIKEDAGYNGLCDGIKDYNLHHGESAVLLYSSTKNLFE